jgi:predicted DNA-binding protein
MKTAISLPDRTYIRINRAARRLKMTRSRFIVEATEAYLSKMERGNITKQINDFIEQYGQPEIESAILASSNSILRKSEW